MTYLLHLLSDTNLRRQAALKTHKQTPLQIQPSIREMFNPEGSASDLSNDSSAAHSNTLFHNPTQDSANQGPINQQDNDSHHLNATHTSHVTTNAFAREFGPMVVYLDVDQLERDRATILQPLLESDYSKIEVSNITRHMWAHWKDMHFNTKDEMYTWARKIGKSILPVTSALKLTGNRFCNLCMKERIAIFNAMHNKKTLTI